jgi:hypothetical protein
MFPGSHWPGCANPTLLDDDVVVHAGVVEPTDAAPVLMLAPLRLIEGRETAALVPLLLRMQAESFWDFPSDLSLTSPISSTSTDSSTVIDPAITKHLCLLVEADDVWAAALHAQDAVSQTSYCSVSGVDRMS